MNDTVTTPAPVSIDVRDMLCAQALAVVSEAMARIAVGASIDVRFNSADVQRDIEVWARDRGHVARFHDSNALMIQRGRSTHD